MKKLLAILPLTLAACSKDGGTEPPKVDNITARFSNFPAHSIAGHYELWVSFALPRDGGLDARHSAAASAGKFLIAPSGNAVDLDLDPIVFEIDPADTNARVDGDGNILWQLAVDAFVTLEALDDSDDEPNLPALVAGGFQLGRAVLDVDEADAIRVDLGSAAGGFLLATPSTPAGDEDEGVWFVDTVAGTAAGLALPPIASGAPWTYAGWWADGFGQPYPLGTFLGVSGVDSDGAGPLGGTGFLFPGSDFPTGQMGVSLANGTVFVTLEPPGDVDGTGPYLTILTAPVGGVSAGTPVSLDALPLPGATVDIPFED